MAFGILDTEIILRLLARAEQAAGASAPRIVLIGGQAVNFWAELYRSREPALQEGPFTSKDVDFQAGRATVDWVAQALGVKASKPSKDHATEQTGKIVFTMPSGETCEIDFLRRSIPNLEQDVIDRAVPATLSDGSSFWVMHPLHCMFSRVYNVIELGGKYNNEHGRAQLRASVNCLRLFTLELAQTDLREALNICKEVYEYAKGNDVGRRAYREIQIDPFDAVPHDRALSDAFYDRGYPAWRDDLKRRRERYRAPNHAAR